MEIKFFLEENHKKTSRLTVALSSFKSTMFPSDKASDPLTLISANSATTNTVQ